MTLHRSVLPPRKAPRPPREPGPSLVVNLIMLAITGFLVGGDVAIILASDWRHSTTEVPAQQRAPMCEELTP
jgi:hypothetical protein